MDRFIVVILSSIAVLAPAVPARAADDPPGRLWLDFGLGYGNMNSSTTIVSAGGGGLWLDAQIGGRITSQWLAGLDIGGLGMQANSGNYDPNNYYSSIYGQTRTNVFLVTQFEQKKDNNSAFGAGVGEVIYSNKSLDDYFGYSKTYSGLGGLARVGYDWSFSNRSHFETVFNYEGPFARAPIGGTLKFSIACSVSCGLPLILRHPLRRDSMSIHSLTSWGFKFLALTLIVSAPVLAGAGHRFVVSATACRIRGTTTYSTGIRASVRAHSERTLR